MTYYNDKSICIVHQRTKQTEYHQRYTKWHNITKPNLSFFFFFFCFFFFPHLFIRYFETFSVIARGTEWTGLCFGIVFFFFSFFFLFFFFFFFLLFFFRLSVPNYLLLKAYLQLQNTRINCLFCLARFWRCLHFEISRNKAIIARCTDMYISTLNECFAVAIKYLSK